MVSSVPVKKRSKEQIAAEIEDIRQASADGLLRPADVVDRARDPGNILHPNFEWEDSKAAESYRLWQARQLIVTFVVAIGPRQRVVQQYISLTSDRKEAGYRSTIEVLSDADYRKQLLADALQELRTFKRKYALLKELADVFAAADALE